MTSDIPATMLLDPQVLDDPYLFYRRLHTEAPVWQVPGTEVFVASTFSTVADATARVTDFLSTMRYLIDGALGRPDGGQLRTEDGRATPP